jgi:cytochrome b561
LLVNNTQSYGWLAIGFHWISAVATIALFALGLWMVGLDYYSVWYQDAPHYHKSFGLLLCAITTARFAWKLFQIEPQAIGKPWEQKLAKLAHRMLYFGLFILFISGYLISTADGRGIDIFNWLTVPSGGEWFSNQEVIAGLMHQYLAYFLMGLVSIHSLAALKHHFVDKDDSLRRMIHPKNLKQPQE